MLRNNIKIALWAVVTLTVMLGLLSCKKQQWQPGTPLSKEKIIIGVLHINDPSSETAGYSYAHQMGIEKMKIKLGLADSQILYKYNVDDVDPLKIETALRSLIANGANIIFATSLSYMDICEKLAQEFTSVIFTHATGNKHNPANFNNYFGRVYQVRYLSGIVAGAQTKTGRIGYVAAWGKENSEVTGGLNAFAMGVEKANPNAKVYVKTIYNWFDPMGEAAAARALIAAGCDVIAQHCDTANPQIEAEKAGVWSIGYNISVQNTPPTMRTPDDNQAVFWVLAAGLFRIIIHTGKPAEKASSLSLK